MWLLAVEVWIVFFFIKVLKSGDVDDEHPWATGLDGEQEPIWPKNIVYRSKGRMGLTEAEDREIVTKVGMFLRSMVKRSVQVPEIEQGQKRRMPHAVNFIHGAVHHNGAYMLFDDFQDLIFHVTDPVFRRDLRRFVKAERREVTFVLRQRDYDPVDYAYCVAAMRAYLPYFTNGNGPSKDPVLWGNKAPYASLNPINGAWVGDLWALYRKDVANQLRPAVQKSYFQSAYAGVRRGFTRVERLMGWLMFLDVRARGWQGQVFFTRRKNFDPKSLEAYRALGYWRWFNVHRVPAPWEVASHTESQRVSVVIPTLNEEDNIVAALASIFRAFHRPQVIVADGGSTDATRVLARMHGAEVVNAPRGRGHQLATGAAAATGDVLLFLHADNQVDAQAGEVLERFFAASESHQVCTMRLRFGRKNPVYRMLGWSTRIDDYFFSYGDQGIACRRSFYDDRGGFPEQVLFEDVEFLRRSRRVARISSVPVKIQASDRRFRKNGLVNELVKNTGLMLAYKRGEDAVALAARYQGH